MRRVAAPVDSASEVFLSCISIVQNNALKARLISIEPNVIAASTEFENAAATATLHTLQPQLNVGGIVSVKEMSTTYEMRMVKQGTPGRAYYDKLMASPLHGYVLFVVNESYLL